MPSGEACVIVYTSLATISEMMHARSLKKTTFNSQGFRPLNAVVNLQLFTTLCVPQCFHRNLQAKGDK